MREIDHNNEGWINYTEFLAAAVGIKKILTEDKLRAIFKQFDTDNNGKITAQNIAESMTKMGHTLTSKDFKEITEKHGLTQDKYLTYEELAKLFRDL